MAETVPGYDTEVWWGLLRPAGMAADVVATLSRDFVAALNTDAVKERLTKLGALPIGSSPQQFDANSLRLQQMGPDHNGRRHESRMTPMIPDLSPAARRQPAESAAAAERLRYPCPRIWTGGPLSLCR